MWYFYIYQMLVFASLVFCGEYSAFCKAKKQNKKNITLQIQSICLTPDRPAMVLLAQFNTHHHIII